MTVQIGSFHSPESWFDMRDLGPMFGHEEPLPHPACDQAATASQDHQRSVARRRRDGCRTVGMPVKFEGHHGARAGPPYFLVSITTARSAQSANTGSASVLPCILLWVAR